MCPGWVEERTRKQAEQGVIAVVSVSHGHSGDDGY